jgi:hypothetical protein
MIAPLTLLTKRQQQPPFRTSCAISWLGGQMIRKRFFFCAVFRRLVSFSDNLQSACFRFSDWVYNAEIDFSVTEAN